MSKLGEQFNNNNNNNIISLFEQIWYNHSIT